MAHSCDRRAFLTGAAGSLAAAGMLGSSGTAAGAKTQSDAEWRFYGGDQGASRYSSLAAIHADNVGELEVAWTHHTGDSRIRPSTTIECTPICLNGVLYLTTARLKLQALAAATGELLWSFDPFAGQSGGRSRGVNRGVAWWSDGDEVRIFFPAGEDLWAIDAKTGRPLEEFGKQGRIDLKEHFDRDMSELSFTHSSPPVVYQDLVITGGGGGEGPYPSAPGHIRGWDARTGERRWIFHTIPHPGEYGYRTWPSEAWKTVGGANNWGGMSLDPVDGTLFVSTGSPAFDFYGGSRHGQNLFGNSVIALNAATGERNWHFQTVHHDVWDYDLPSQPILCRSTRNGRPIDAVAQLTKTGLCFVFDRRTGQPIFGVEERLVPSSDVPGERLWPTQPFPLKPPPLTGQQFTADDITDVSPQARAYVKEIFDQSRSGPIFTPPSLQGTIIKPGFLGGALWGGGSFDPASGYLYVNTSENANLMTLVEGGPDKPYPYGHKGYTRFLDHEGHAPSKPPWGYLTCIDLNDGDFVWRETLGEYPELTARGVPKTGTRQIGGSIVTAGGVVFIGATMDERVRAIDSKTGAELWSHQLNAGGYATPCTYEVDGRQFVVIAAGGGNKQRTKSGDEIVAFALPG